MSISITATFHNALNPAQGTWEPFCTLTVTGLTAGQASTFSATSDGTSTGTPLLNTTTRIIGAPNYVPSSGTSGTWFETSAPDTDANGNVQFHITSGSSGPTSFRIGLRYGPE